MVRINKKDRPDISRALTGRGVRAVDGFMATSCGACGFGISIAGFPVGVKFGLDDFATMGEINMRNSVSS